MGICERNELTTLVSGTLSVAIGSLALRSWKGHPSFVEHTENVGMCFGTRLFSRCGKWDAKTSSVYRPDFLPSSLVGISQEERQYDDVNQYRHVKYGESWMFGNFFQNPVAGLSLEVEERCKYL